jgi:hypothetical protein
VLSITVHQPSFVIHHPLSNMKLLTLSTFCSIAILACADNVKDASSLNKESGAINNVDLAMSLSGAPDTLNPGDWLERGGRKSSRNGRFHLDMQEDGNLVLYRADDNRPIWHTDTWVRPFGWHNGGYQVVMQTDGNLVVYAIGADGTERAIWDSKTTGRGENYLVVQDDGNLVIYSVGTVNAQWASGTDWADMARSKKATYLRSEPLDATHVANISAMTMQGAVPHTVTKIAHFDKDAASADGASVVVGAPDQASKATFDGTI